MRKKCPVCNSTKYEKIEDDFKCARCGYINKSTENINKDLKNQED
jgi:rubredoxin